MSYAHQDATREPRLAARLSVQVSTLTAEVDGRSGESSFRCAQEICANVSEGGAFIETDEPVSLGRKVLLEIELPTGQVVETIARVMWSKTPFSHRGRPGRLGMGVQFVDTAVSDRATLGAFVARSLPADPAVVRAPAVDQDVPSAEGENVTPTRGGSGPIAARPGTGA